MVLDEKENNSILNRIYWFYRRKFYSKLKHIRGSYRLKLFLRKLCFNPSKIDEEKIEKVTEKDWDNLIILDACRHDVYKELTGVESFRYSRGSCTQDYIRENFSDGDFEDIVYIHGNGFLTDGQLKDLTGRNDIFHEKFDTILTSWNEDEGTVLPTAIARDAATAERLFPDKRKIIHFIQPHMPFVRSKLRGSGVVKPENDQENTWELVEAGEIDHKEALDAYRDNLELVMERVENLEKKLDGKTVVTADHGELIGEAGVYGHPCGRKDVELRKVPWDVRSRQE